MAVNSQFVTDSFLSLFVNYDLVIPVQYKHSEQKSLYRFTIIMQEYLRKNNTHTEGVKFMTQVQPIPEEKYATHEQRKKNSSKEDGTYGLPLILKGNAKT